MIKNCNDGINGNSVTPKPQVFVAKGSSPWCFDNWDDIDKIISVDKSAPDQVTITCKDVTNTCSMFEDCYDLISLDVSNFDTSKVKDMTEMFYNCYKLDFDLSKWKLENLKTCFSDPFRNCKSLSCDLSKWKYLKKIFELNKNSFHGCDKCKF